MQIILAGDLYKKGRDFADENDTSLTAIIEAGLRLFLKRESRRKRREGEK